MIIQFVNHFTAGPMPANRKLPPRENKWGGGGKGSVQRKRKKKAKQKEKEGRRQEDLQRWNDRGQRMKELAVPRVRV